MPNVTLASHNRGIIPIIGEIASVNLVGTVDRVVVGRMTSVPPCRLKQHTEHVWTSPEKPRSTLNQGSHIATID